MLHVVSVTEGRGQLETARFLMVWKVQAVAAYREDREQEMRVHTVK